MDLDRNQLSALTRLFSAAVLRELGTKGRSPLFARLALETRLIETAGARVSVGEFFEFALELLDKSGRRDEYVFRSAITQRILLGRHSLNTASILNEFRVGTNKADIVILNGTSTAYEIKSERDSLSRLARQVTAYGKVFAAVNVVCSEIHTNDVLNIVPDDVGVMTLTTRGSLSTLRAAVPDPARTSPTAVLDALRITEALEICQSLGVEIPPLPNTELRSALETSFAQFDPAVVQAQMVKTLKRSRSQAVLASSLRTLPKSLQAAALSMKFDQQSIDRVRDAALKPIDDALAWS